MVTTYRELIMWQRAMEMVKAIYAITATFPVEERYGLTSQLQRAAVSVPANIAERWGRNYRKEYLHHLSIAKGSLAEVETYLILVKDLGFLTVEDGRGAWELSQEVGKMLTSTITKLRQGKPIDE